MPPLQLGVSIMRAIKIAAAVIMVMALFAARQSKAEQPAPTTTETTGTTTWSTFPPDWPESSPEAKKTRDAIFELLPESAYEHWWAAYGTAHEIATVFDQLGIPELKEIEIIEEEETRYLVRFVDIKDNSYRIYVGKDYGYFGFIWKEGEENPIYSGVIL